jgi:predicted CopG family antitoxin
MINKTENKTIVIHKVTYDMLEKMKQHPRQSFNEIIWISINKLEQRKNKEKIKSGITMKKLPPQYINRFNVEDLEE